MKYLAVPYSLACYLLGFAALSCLIFFIGDLVLPWTINKPSPLSPNFAGGMALMGNILLVTIWSLQHSIMADPRFKQAWTRVIPASVERSTYVLATALFTAALIAMWSPMPQTIWNLGQGTLATLVWIGFWAGWSITLISTYLINHFELFGVAQAMRSIRDRGEQSNTRFVTPMFYRLVRHPMMTGMLIAIWCAPEMTLGRLVFNITMTGYIVIGTGHEEKTLVAELGEKYRDYQRTTPKLIPLWRSKAAITRWQQPNSRD